MENVASQTLNTATRVAARQVTANESNDPNVGSAQDPTKNSNSASTVLSTLAPVALVALIWFLLFLILRVKFPRKYSPRSFLGSLRQGERSPQLPKGFLSWIKTFATIPDTYVLNHHSIDAYLFLRLLRISVVCCLVGCLITWPVLFPVNITGGGGLKQLDILTMSNVDTTRSSNSYRFFAHAGCAYLFFGFIMFMITRESIFYINLRQAYLMSPLYASRMSSRVVLFTAVPNDYLNEGKLREMFGSHLRRIWIPTDTKELEDVVENRDKIAMKLEAAETKLVKTANAARLKSLKGSGSHNRSNGDGFIDSEMGQEGTSAARWIKPKQRPTHRLKPLIGKKVDTIEWSRAELHKLIPKVEEMQDLHRRGEAKYLNSVFVEFDSVSEAQAAYQSLTHHQVLHMAPRYTGLNPSEIIWKNLRIKWWERILRVLATTAFVVALVIFWSIPVAFIASISNINSLTQILPWLDFINRLPSVVLGVVTGLLPVVLLAALMALLPIILRLMAKISGDPTLSAVELTVQNYYFGFQVVQVFLVASLGSAASASVQSVINNPSSVTNLLAQQLPKASNFYLAYFILQGLGVVSSMLVGLVGLILLIVLGKLLDKTPRKMFRRWTQLSGVGWGTVFPVYTNLFVIAICYACIAPLVLVFAAIGLYLFYFAYRYNLLFVNDASIDTKGLVYPRALQHLFVGLYVAELCLIGLFGIQAGKPGGLGALILMVVLLVFTALYQMSLNSALSPLLKYLPKSLEAEERRLLALDNGDEAEYSYAKNGTDALRRGNSATDGFQEKGRLSGPPHKKPNFIQKFFRPDVYADYQTLRRLVPKDYSHISYAETTERNAYFHPAITSSAPLLWIPRDDGGVSRQEVRDTSKVIPITDEGARFNEKNKIEWDHEDARPPIYEEKIYY